jgi:hypothetical protein
VLQKSFKVGSHAHCNGIDEVGGNFKGDVVGVKQIRSEQAADLLFGHRLVHSVKFENGVPVD